MKDIEERNKYFHLISEDGLRKYQRYMECLLQYFKYDRAESLHQDLYELVSRRLGDEEGEWKHKMYEFLVYTSLNAQGGFKSSSDVTQSISMLLFIIRGVLLQEACLRKSNEPIRNATSFEEPTIYAVLKRLTKQLSSNMSIAVDKISWLNETFTELSIGGKNVSLTHLRNFVRKCKANCEDILKRMWGSALPNLSQKLKDTAGSVKPGLDLIVYNNALFIKLFRRAKALRATWASKDIRNLERDIFALCHVSLGQPPRATEYKDLSFTNGRSRARNFIKYGNRYAFVQYVSKTQKATGKERPIVRFVHPSIEKIVLAYLFIIQPVLKNEKTKPSSCIFSQMGQAPTEHQVSCRFKESFLLHGKCSLGFQEYRHVADAFSKRHMVSAIVLDESAWEEQAGHTATTSTTCYGRSSSDVSTLNHCRFLEFEACSSRWQKFLGLKMRNEKGDKSNNENESSDSDEDHPQDNQDADEDSSDINEENEDTDDAPIDADIAENEEIENDISDSNDDHPQDNQDADEDSSDINEENEDTDDAPIDENAIESIREQLGYEDWMSEAQKDATKMTVACKRDVLAVLPTAGGKSLVSTSLYSVTSS
jgi:hypothetical protein